MFKLVCTFILLTSCNKLLNKTCINIIKENKIRNIKIRLEVLLNFPCLFPLFGVGHPRISAPSETVLGCPETHQCIDRDAASN